MTWTTMMMNRFKDLNLNGTRRVKAQMTELYGETCVEQTKITLFNFFFTSRYNITAL